MVVIIMITAYQWVGTSSCKTFEIFYSTSVEWIAQKKFGIQKILRLLDDFLIVAPPDSLCQKQLDIFLS